MHVYFPTLDEHRVKVITSETKKRKKNQKKKIYTILTPLAIEKNNN